MTNHPGPPPVIRERYQLVTWLGEGGMGVVYKAHDILLKRDVAVKFLSPKYFSGAEAVARFLREARLVARLSHPNIMSIYDVGEDQGWQYLVFEYIPGNNLHSINRNRTQAWSVIEILPILKAVLTALAYAHEQGVIHRDIKPENIMLTPQGQVKVADFGLAFAQEEIRLTHADGMVGTVLYMSPEMMHGDEIDARTDLYSLGAVLYELLTGEPPFTGEQLTHIISKVIHTDYTPISTKRSDLPPTFESVITRLLMKKPDQRFATAKDALIALESKSEPSTDTTVSTSIPPVTSSLLRSIVRSSSSEIHRGKADELADEERPLLRIPKDPEEITPLTQDFLLYASTEDVVAALEAERHRMAGLLKDNIIEPLNLLLSQAGTYEKTLGANQMARMVVSVLSTLARQVMQQVRDLDENLHPLALESTGLEPALENLANQLRRTRGLQINLQLMRLPDRLPARLELALFRLTQNYLDAIQTVNASHVNVGLKRVVDTLEFELINDARLIMDERILAASREWIEQLGGSWFSHPDRNHITLRFGLLRPIELTPRELEVIRLVAEGLSNKQIGQTLNISPRTVNFHLDNLFLKLGVRSRTEAAILALRQGWVKRT